MVLPNEIKVQCLKIMERLMARPCAAFFLDYTSLFGIINTNQDGGPNSSLIKSPIDLNIIKNRLNSSEYNSILSWSKDMRLVWENAQKFYRKDPNIGGLIGGLADELRRQFEKEYKVLKELYNSSLLKWVKRCSELKDQIDSLLDNPPVNVHQYGTFTDNYIIENEYELEDTELNTIIQGTMFLTSPADERKITQIISKNEGTPIQKDENNRIDISSLSPNTVKLIRQYTWQRLDQMGIPIPI